MSVNLSPVQFSSPHLLQDVRSVIERHAIAPRHLPAPAAGAVGARRRHFHRRLRHRLFQPAVPEAAAGHRDQDRPRLRARPGAQR
ncbi:hypothetical protein G6F59_016927 [Rhizopus arrhizus]|nr:hypothetical protein G6F59_016927 [Rhizopus arrhizus]